MKLRMVWNGLVWAAWAMLLVALISSGGVSARAEEAYPAPGEPYPAPVATLEPGPLGGVWVLAEISGGEPNPATEDGRFPSLKGREGEWGAEMIIPRPHRVATGILRPQQARR